MECVSFGVPKLDDALRFDPTKPGGIPKGYLTLIIGNSGSGKELFAKQFSSVQDNAMKVYITTDERKDDILSTMALFHWQTNIDVQDEGEKYHDRILLKQLEIEKLRADGLSVTDLLKLDDHNDKDDREYSNFLTRLQNFMSDWEPPYRIAIDSIDYYLQNFPLADVMKAVRSIKTHAAYNKSNVLMTLSKGMHQLNVELGMQSIADIVIEMEINKVASEFETSLTVSKVKNHPHLHRILTYSVTEHGIVPEMVSRVS